MKRFPVWIFPLTLLVFITGIFIWLGVSGKIPWSPSLPEQVMVTERSLDEKGLTERNRLIQETRPKSESENPDFLKFFESSDRKEKEAFQETEESKKASLALAEAEKRNKIRSLYHQGYRLFTSGAYENAALKFEEFLSQALPEMEEQKIKARIYLAYACLFSGDRHGKEKLLERSRSLFLDLYRNMPARNPFIPQIVLGMARTSRLLEDYPDGLEVILKENLILTSGSLQKHFYLELGYLYFNLNRLELALPYFQKSGLPLAHRHVYEILLQKEGTALYLLTLFSKGMIPGHHLKDYKSEIQKKILSEAKSYYQKQKKEEAFFLLKKLLTEFPDEAITEEANFWLGELYARDLQFQKALYFYDQALSNQFPDYDAVSLFRKAMLYNQSGNIAEALRHFNLIRSNFVSSQYYQPALDWIREIEKRQAAQDALTRQEPLKKDEIQAPIKKKEMDDDDLFFKEEIPSDDLY